MDKEEMTDSILINNYKDFVDTLTSEPSTDLQTLIERLLDLEKAGVNIPRLSTAAIGMSSEAGEFLEIVKKVLYQKKEWNEDVRFHLKRELGDQIFYWIMACMALEYDPVEIIEENVAKLESRYPGGKFDVHHSENRKHGDL